MSSRLGTYELQEAVEQIYGVVRSRTGFGVVLGGCPLDVLQHKALHRSVVEIHVAELGGAEVRLPAHRLVGLDPRLAVWSNDREAMVLRSDVDAPGRKVLDGVVGPAA